MRKTRFMSVLFLVLALAFFFVREFRQGLSTSIIVGFNPQEESWVEEAGHFSASTLAGLAERAEREEDARTLAFVAMYSPEAEEKIRLAERAVLLDPELQWILAETFHKRDLGELPPEWLARLQEWDPENATPYLLEGEKLWQERELARFSGADSEPLGKLAAETDWRVAMGRGFAAEKMDDYHAVRFHLEREVLRRHGLDEPAVIYSMVAHYPVPSFDMMKQFANLLVHKLGREAEENRREEDALFYYWMVYHMGERLHMQSRLERGRVVGGSLLWIAGEPLLPLLRRMGREDEALTLELAEAQFDQRQAVLRGEAPLARTTNYYWHGLWTHLFSALVLLSGGFTLLCVGYVNAKQWVRTDKKGWLYDALTISENYAPILWFLSCLGLYISYYPFAQNFDFYMTAEGPINDFEIFFANVLPGARLVGEINLPLENPFAPYMWYALAGVALLFGGAHLLRRGKQG